ncbi:MAG: S41 family peptidase [Bryobacteraceae bacterium]|nr:S41 family peptidase [Bryobacteraceae bacterium]
MLVILLLLGAAVGTSASSPDDAYRHLSVYTEVLSRIKSEYVEEPDIKNVTLGAMNGMLEAIDPFASYLSAEQYKQYLKSQDAKKAGVGLVLSRRFGYVGVVDVIPGSSAWKEGLTTGDMLESINGVGTRDMPLAYAEMALMGDPNTSIEVSVLRVRKPDPTKMTLTRGFTKYPSVTSKMLQDGLGIIQLPALVEGRVKEVQQAADALQKQGAKKLILDLRNSGFGKPEFGIELANLFLDTGLITYVQGQKMRREDFKADPARASLKSIPLVVLTNRGTANAAEVAAAALLDNKRAEVVGERTYGDASVRKAITLDDGSAVLLAVAKYYSPSGKAIQDTGVTPTHPVTDLAPVSDDDEDDATPPAPDTAKKPEGDEILKKAIEVSTGSVAQNSPLTGPASPQGLPERQNPLTIQK